MNKLDEELERQRLEKATQKMLRREIRCDRITTVLDGCAGCVAGIPSLIFVVLVLGAFIGYLIGC